MQVEFDTEWAALAKLPDNEDSRLPQTKVPSCFQAVKSFGKAFVKTGLRCLSGDFWRWAKCDERTQVESFALNHLHCLL